MKNKMAKQKPKPPVPVSTCTVPVLNIADFAKKVYAPDDISIRLTVKDLYSPLHYGVFRVYGITGNFVVEYPAVTQPDTPSGSLSFDAYAYQDYYTLKAGHEYDVTCKAACSIDGTNSYVFTAESSKVRIKFA